MEKAKIYFGKFALVVCLFALGVLAGSLLESNKIKEENGSLYNITKIAVVNLDEGVRYKKEDRNFAREIVEAKNDNYVITGLDDAKKGITDGRYAAYIILPSNFSSNVTSINAEPKKSLLKYKISGDLSKDATDKAWVNVMKLKEELNDDVGFVYISSILSEFHNGQNNALKVLGNDSKDKKVLMAISNLDLVATLDLREVERLQSNIEELNINTDVETNKSIIDAIDKSYKNYLSETSSQLEELKKESNNINDNISNVYDNAEKIESVYKSDGRENYSIEGTQSFIEKFNKTLADNLKDVNNNITEVNKGSIESNNEAKNNLNGQVSKLLDDIDHEHKNVYDGLKLSVKSLFDEVFYYDEDGFKLDDDKYPDIYKFLDKYKNKIVNDESENFDEQYLTKLILTGLAGYDYTQENVTFESIVQSIDNSIENREELNTALKNYAISIGLSQQEAEEFTLYKFITYIINKPIKKQVNNIPLQRNQFYEDFETAFRSDMVGRRNEFVNKIDLNNSNSLKEKFKDNINMLLNTIQGILPTDIGNVQDSVNELQQNSSVDTNLISDYIYIDLKDLNNRIVEEKDNLLETIDNHSNISNEFKSKFLVYDPLLSIDENEIENYVKGFETNNNEMQSKIQNKNSQYLKFVSDSYENADKHIQSIREDVKKYQKESDDKVTKGLENAKEVKKETASNNSKLMHSYVSKLTYTRNGSIGSTDVYDFVIKPSDMEGAKAINSVEAHSVNYNKIFKDIILTTSIIWFILYIGTIIKKKNKKNVIKKNKI